MDMYRFLAWFIVSATVVVSTAVYPPFGVALAFSVVIIWLLMGTQSKVRKLKNGNVLTVKLKREKFAVPVDLVFTHHGWMVESVVPELKGTNVIFVKETTRIANVTLVDENKSYGLDHEIIKQTSVLIQEVFCNIEPKIVELNHKIKELEKIKRLTSSSDIYSQQSDLYKRAIYQIKGMIQDMKKLENTCRRLIREILIGSEISKLESAKPPPDILTLKIETTEKYKAIETQYQRLNHDIGAWSELHKELGAAKD